MTIKLGQTIAQKMQQFQAPSPQQSNPSVVSGVNVNVKQMIRQIESRQLLKDSVPTKPVAKQAAKTISVISRNEPVTSQVIQRVLIPEIVRSSENLKRSLMTEKLDAIRLEVEGAINEEQEDNELPLAEDGILLFMTKIKKLTQEKESLSREIENQNVIAKQVQQDILNVMGCPVSVLGIVDQYVYSEAEFSKNIAKLSWANLDIIKKCTKAYYAHPIDHVIS